MYRIISPTCTLWATELCHSLVRHDGWQLSGTGKTPLLQTPGSISFIPDRFYVLAVVMGARFHPAVSCIQNSSKIDVHNSILCKMSDQPA